GPEQAGGNELVAEDPRHADHVIVVVLTRTDLKHRWASGVGRLAPIQGWMRAENVETAQQKNRERDDIDPVHHAHRQRVPIVEVASRARRLSLAALWGRDGRTRRHRDSYDFGVPKSR